MADQHEADVEFFPPTRPHGENRDETLDRVVRDGHLDEGPEPIDSDFTTATGGNRRIARKAGIVMAAGAVVGALAGLILTVIPGPFDTESTSGTVGYMLVMGFAVGVIVALVATLLMLEREDGRMEHEVEDYTAHHPDK
ncbi:MAG: hypothetical protein ACLGG9_06600 [Thermoleophilia bacterium]|jgi:hypothetical protein